MLAGSKEEHDLVISKTLEKVTKMSLDNALVYDTKLNSNHEALAFLLKELLDAEAALTSTKEQIITLQQAIFSDFNQKEIIKQFERVAFDAMQLIHTSLILRTKAFQAIVQLHEKEKAPNTDGHQ